MKVKARSGPVHPRKSQRRKEQMKLAMTQVTVKVEALSGPVHPRKSQRRKEHMKLALTQVTVGVKVLSRLLNPKKGKKKTPEIGRPSTSKHRSKRKHYKRRTCPICHKSVTVIRRHIIKIHVQKNEKIPLARADGDNPDGLPWKQNAGSKKKGRERKKPKDISW